MNKGFQLFDGNPIKAFLDASTILDRAVEHTLGNKGYNTAIPTSNSFLSIINDGKTIIERMSDSDPAINLAMNTLKESSLATNKNAGDGTTSTIVLQHQLLSKICYHNNALLDQGKTNFITSKDIINYRDILLKKLPNLKKEVQSDDDLRKVITSSLGSDEYTDLVLSAFKDLDINQKPSLIKQNSSDKIEVITSDGVPLNPVEVNPIPLRTFPASSDEPLNVLIITQQISRIDQAFTKLLQKISQSDKKTILLYTEIMPSVLDQLHFNIQEGSLNMIPIRLACPVTKLDDIVHDLEMYFNCIALDDIHQYQTEYNNPNIFGSASGYVINKDSAIIKPLDTIDYTGTELPSTSSVISVGFITYSQQEELYRRLEDAIYSAYHARLYGYTIGGGFNYKSLVPEYDEVKDVVIKDALSYIFKTIYSTVEDEFKTELDFIDYCSKNVYDSYKVTEQVILNAFTVIAQVLSTREMLIPLEKKLQ